MIVVEPSIETDQGDRVLLIDDDLELSTMLKEYLETEGFLVQVESNGRDGIDAALKERHDVVVLDIMLPRLNGMDLLRDLRKTSQIPVLMLSAKGDNIERVIGLECGADDYLAKPCYPRELVARLRALLRRIPKGDGAAASKVVYGPVTVDLQEHHAFIDDHLLPLTASEFGLLSAFVKAGASVSTKVALAQLVLGRPHQAYDRSLDVHVSNMRPKIASLSKVVRIENVRGVGYRLRVEP